MIKENKEPYSPDGLEEPMQGMRKDLKSALDEFWRDSQGLFSMLGEEIIDICLAYFIKVKIGYNVETQLKQSHRAMNKKKDKKKPGEGSGKAKI
ncbi:hypothetical protein ES705_22841 [subsurface metagenome]